MGKINRVEEMSVYQMFYKLALEVERMTRDYGFDFHWLRIQSLIPMLRDRICLCKYDGRILCSI